tara:strand:- start:646 stop:1368 length:723 start_codon:yes stop_codon:yes gene_type:complete
MKIRFIISGWHYNRIDEFYDGLLQLEKDNDFIKVFWACHAEPTEYVKSNFDYKYFPKIGLSDTKYQQALDYLGVEDDEIVFFMHDDIVIKNWEFIGKSIEFLNQGYKVVGNGLNYPDPFNPFVEPIDKWKHIKNYKIPNWMKNKKYIDFVKEENKHIFDNQQVSSTVKLAFMCMKRGDLRKVGDFEPTYEYVDKPIGPAGNITQSLLGYKLTKIFGTDKFAYLSNDYSDSDYIYECLRGK